jgi:hypothetical protein
VWPGGRPPSPPPCPGRARGPVRWCGQRPARRASQRSKPSWALTRRATVTSTKRRWTRPQRKVMRNRAWSEDVSAVMSPSRCATPARRQASRKSSSPRATGRRAPRRADSRCPENRDPAGAWRYAQRRSHLRCVRAGAVTAAGRGVWLVRNSPLGHKPLPHGVQSRFGSHDPWPWLVGQPQPELLVDLGLVRRFGAGEYATNAADRVDQASDLLA